MMITYAKTPKGGSEMEHRRDLRDSKLRRLLILIDGNRTVTELKKMFGTEPVEDELQQLVNDGYIEPVGGVATAGENALLDAGDDGGFDLSSLPESRGPDALPKAKNFIINTLTHFHGPYTKLDLMRAAQSSKTHQELRQLYPQWVRCMREERNAAKRLPDLQKQLFEVL